MGMYIYMFARTVRQVDRGVPFSMASSLKEQADEVASAETERLEAKEASIKKTSKDEVG